MDSESEHEESIEGQVEAATEKRTADWGKTKFNYYFTDYVDKDYPSNLTRKEEKLAAIEQDEALRLQRKLFSTLDNVNLDPVIDYGDSDDEFQSASDKVDLIEFIEKQNKEIVESKNKKQTDTGSKKRKVRFEQPEEVGSDECEFDDDDDDGEDDESQVDNGVEQYGRRRRPINVAIKKNRGLTPYKKKEYRNPRVKHKLKYKKAMTKRRRLVKEAQTEFHRYSGESTGIKTSTVRSIKLC